jgi:hypothetical protein
MVILGVAAEFFIETALSGSELKKRVVFKWLRIDDWVAAATMRPTRAKQDEGRMARKRRRVREGRRVSVPQAGGNRETWVAKPEAPHLLRARGCWVMIPIE